MKGLAHRNHLDRKVRVLQKIKFNFSDENVVEKCTKITYGELARNLTLLPRKEVR